MQNETRKNDERKTTLKRRDLLKALGTVPTAALVPALARGSVPAVPAMQGQAPAAAKTAGYQPKALDPHEWKTVEVLSDWIIPADERSGSATQAGVPAFIDDWLDFKGGEEADAIHGGILWLDLESNRQSAHDFVDCSRDQQKQMLDRIAYPKTAALEDAAGVAFFNRLRDLVVTGFFSSKMGVKDLPYLGNQMLAEWPGCPANVLSQLGLEKS